MRLSTHKRDLHNANVTSQHSQKTNHNTLNGQYCATTYKHQKVTYESVKESQLVTREAQTASGHHVTSTPPALLVLTAKSTWWIWFPLSRKPTTPYALLNQLAFHLLKSHEPSLAVSSTNRLLQGYNRTPFFRLDKLWRTCTCEKAETVTSKSSRRTQENWRKVWTAIQCIN